MRLYITPSGRVYCPDIGRFLQKDPLARPGENPYVYARNNPLRYVDPTGLGPFAIHIQRIEEFLANDQTDLAAHEAYLLYNLMSTGAPFSGYPLASGFLQRWLSRVGGTRILTEGECKSILTEERVEGTWVSAASSLKDGEQTNVKDKQYTGLTATNPSDIFYAFGFFTVTFTGCIARKGSTGTLTGTFQIADRYDWQDCGNKYVVLAHDRIKDQYAQFVENAGLARAFDVRGTYKGTISVQLPAPGPQPKPSRLLKNEF
jgi:hypothetical protein